MSQWHAEIIAQMQGTIDRLRYEISVRKAASVEAQRLLDTDSQKTPWQALAGNAFRVLEDCDLELRKHKIASNQIISGDIVFRPDCDLRTQKPGDYILTSDGCVVLWTNMDGEYERCYKRIQ